MARQEGAVAGLAVARHGQRVEAGAQAEPAAQARLKQMKHVGGISAVSFMMKALVDFCKKSR
jgi:hypothetical protein